MKEFPESLERLVEEFRKLPTVGKKTAQRMALHFVGMEGQKIEKFAQALLDVKDKIHRCRICGNITEEEKCGICSNPMRDQSVVCVVEDVSNLMAMERGNTFHGLYHVLNGLISPAKGMGPDEIGVDELLKRLPRKGDKSDSVVREVILAISATVEGETTILFLAELLKNYNVKVTRIASGIPVGGSLEYYDELTLSRAIQDRRMVED